MTQALPPGWQEVALADVCTGVPQFGPSAASDSFAYIDLGAIDNKAKRIIEPSVIATTSAPSRAKQLVAPGDVLFSTVRVYLENIAMVPNELQGAIASTAFSVLRPTAAIDAGYLYGLVTSKRFVQAVNALQRGNSPPSVQDGDVRSQRVPLPPIQEQQRIVSRIEELFSEIDEGERALERVGRLVQRYRQSVLKAAVTGELTREWREARSENTAAGAASSGDLPRGWVQTTLGALSTKVTSGSRDWKSFYGRGDGVFIMAQNVRPGRLDLSELQLVDPPAGSKDAERSQVAEDDLLVTIVGANTGDACRVDRPLAKHYVCQSVALIRLADPRQSPFIELFLMAGEGGQAQFAETIYGAGRPHLSFDQLKAVNIPLPPPDEQAAILDAASEAESELKETVAAVAASRRQAAALRQYILKAAFSGQLVPQDPRDEPASALLARLTAQTSATPAAPKRRGRPPRRRPSQSNPEVADQCC